MTTKKCNFSLTLLKDRRSVSNYHWWLGGWKRWPWQQGIYQSEEGCWFYLPIGAKQVQDNFPGKILKSYVNLGNFWFYQNAGRPTGNLIGFHVLMALMAPFRLQHRDPTPQEPCGALQTGLHWALGFDWQPEQHFQMISTQEFNCRRLNGNHRQLETPSPRGCTGAAKTQNGMIHWQCSERPGCRSFWTVCSKEQERV